MDKGTYIVACISVLVAMSIVQGITIAMEPVAAATPVEAPYVAVAEAPPIVTPIVMEASVVESPATLAPMETAIPVASPMPETDPSAPNRHCAARHTATRDRAPAGRAAGRPRGPEYTSGIER